jgi:hypothetical protein
VHLGFALAPLGAVGRSQWTDWIDVLTPYGVLLGAAAALHGAGAHRRARALYLVGAITYTEGHGIHIAANSVYDTYLNPTAHLWDETVGHYVWYAGTALVFAALATAFARTPPPRTPLQLPLSLGVAITWTTNSLRHHRVDGHRRRRRLHRLGLADPSPPRPCPSPRLRAAVVMLTAYGAWYRGFPPAVRHGLDLTAHRRRVAGV